MTYIKLLTVLAGLALLTACGGSSPTTPANNSTGGDNSGGDNSGGDNSGGDNNGGDNSGGNANPCDTNPFGTTCGNDFNDERLMVCRGESTSTRCDTTINPICELDFNDALCRGRPKYDNLLLADTEKRNGIVNTADWLTSFTDTLATAPVSTHTTNQFLSGLTETLPVVTGLVIGNGSGSLTLAHGDLRIVNGDMDGVSFFTGNFGNTIRYYAGIHATTNLGAPISNASQAGNWTGRIRSAGSIQANQSFTLVVDFTTSKISAFIDAESSDLFFDIDGDFGTGGVITGTVILGFDNDDDGVIDTAGLPGESRTPGTLTGLIGVDGAVGAFISGHATLTAGSTPRNYAGGFVATHPDKIPALPEPEATTCTTNCVDTAALLATFTGGDALPTAPAITANSAKNQFLQATITGLDTGGIMTFVLNAPPTTPDVVSLTFNDAFTDGNMEDGVEFFYGNAYFDGALVNITAPLYYAGILAGTNLGAPITETITNARWAGKIRVGAQGGFVRLDEDEIANFGVNITFDATRETKGKITTIFAASGNFYYSIDGDFDENGIITGSVDYGLTTGEGTSRAINTDNFNYSPGTLTGLIGQDGAVGAFISTTTGTGGYSGGFVVKPPE